MEFEFMAIFFDEFFFLLSLDWFRQTFSIIKKGFYAFNDAYCVHVVQRPMASNMNNQKIIIAFFRFSISIVNCESSTRRYWLFAFHPSVWLCTFRLIDCSNCWKFDLCCANDNVFVNCNCPFKMVQRSNSI